MASPIVDPAKGKYFPEMLIEALNEPSVSTLGQKVAGYQFVDRRVTLERAEIITATANMDMVISADSAEKARIRSDSPTINDARRYHKISAKESLDVSMIMTAGGPTANVRSNWNMTVRKPLPVDKLREDIALDSREEEIAELVHLADNLSLGTIPYYQSLCNVDLAKMFDDVIPVDKELAAMAASSESIIGGRAIEVSNQNSHLVVLTGIMVDTTPLPATPDDTFLVVDRDNDPDYMRLDITALTDNVYYPCFIPAIKKLEVRIESATGSGGAVVPCGFSYGVRKLNVSDHIKWEIPLNSPIARSDAQKIITDYPTMAKKIQAGLM